jgi:hypothetical protein
VRAGRSVAQFDSASAMLRATARLLHGRDFAGLGMPVSPLPLGLAVNRLPSGVREAAYTWFGWTEALPPRKLGQVRAEALARWVTERYPPGPYPAVLLGSSNGAAVHLAAALRAPWLPQTLLLPVRQRGVHPDEPGQALQAGRQPGRALLEANPDWTLHHMHDPNQDRLMVRKMACFRVKWRRLPDAYRRLLERELAPGGTIYVVDCGLDWPTTRVGERHVFQFGALGGASAREFHHGSDAVAEYLARYRSHRRRWDPPEPDAARPEAEWGFDPDLLDDLERLASRQGFRVRRLSFQEPEDLSPLVADLYRWWLGRLGRPADRLLVESFFLLDPYWVLRTASVPFWMVFNTRSSADALERYLETVEPYDEIALTLFAHGVDSAGLPPIGRWRQILGRAKVSGRLLGVDERRFPRDFAVFQRYHTAIKRLRPHYELPPPLRVDDLERFLTAVAR